MGMWALVGFVVSLWGWGRGWKEGGREGGKEGGDLIRGCCVIVVRVVLIPSMISY